MLTYKKYDYSNILMNGLKISGILSIPENFQNKGVIILADENNEALSKNLARDGYLSYSVKKSENINNDIHSSVGILKVFCAKIALIVFGFLPENIEDILKNTFEIDVLIVFDPISVIDVDIDIPVRIFSKNNLGGKFQTITYLENDSVFINEDIENSIRRMEIYPYSQLLDILQFI